MKWLKDNSFKLVIIFGFIFLGIITYAHAQSAERINNFAVDIKVNSDSSLAVTETIYYDFQSSEKHGIYRDIPTKYQSAVGNQSITVDHIAVTDEKGHPYIFTTAPQGSNLQIKIGDADTLISGLHTYVIRYRVLRALNYFDSYDEIYWNATGNDWQVPIEKAAVTIMLPRDIDSSLLTTSCYAGVYGQTGDQTNCTKDNLHFESTKSLQPGEGLTVAVGFPKGLVIKPTLHQEVTQFLKDNWIIFLPVLVFIVMFILWYRNGRDPKGRGTIVPEYDSPDNMLPVEVSTLNKGKLETKAISAEIVSLAERGYITITQTERKKILVFNDTDYLLTKIKNSRDDLPEFDKQLMKSLFGDSESVSISDLKNVFYLELPKIEEEVIASLIARNYYSDNPKKVTLKYMSIAVVCILVGIFLISFSIIHSFVMIGSLAVSIIIIVLFALIMPKVTNEGAEALERIKGLKVYISVAEEERIKFHNAPEKNPQLFEKLLPYAMVLGLETKWAEQFKDIYTVSPSWYYGPTNGVFNAVLLSNSLSSFSTITSKAMASAPGGGSGSGGGGFSGGGFGGGGGGSW